MNGFKKKKKMIPHVAWKPEYLYAVLVHVLFNKPIKLALMLFNMIFDLRTRTPGIIYKALPGVPSG